MRQSMVEHTPEAVAIGCMGDIHIPEEEEGVVAGRRPVVKNSWVPGMMQLWRRPRQMGPRPHAIRRCRPPLGSSF
jgi:hypothetical protein